FGLLVGDGNTGGDPGWDGLGGSIRLGWEKNAAGNIVLRPDVYYKDQPGSFGNNFGKQFPATGSLQKGTWYKVTMVVKSNTGSNTDGSVQLLINGTTVLDQAIRWTTNDAKRLVNTICFETFRGGAETYWQSSTNGDIYFDNLKLVQLAR
ncbi:polysaccharide lyase, partial [Flaviaesturariibacter flavus]|uniref:polysaccharide lyase n=1 Tax=Flaviaesturariibacter flavus TaxID=2502780 RepID=UPI001A9F3252